MEDNKNTNLTNDHILEILEKSAKEWAWGRPKEKIEPVVDYLNFLVYSWMGGNGGLSIEDFVLSGDPRDSEDPPANGYWVIEDDEGEALQLSPRGVLSWGTSTEGLHFARQQDAERYSAQRHLGPYTRTSYKTYNNAPIY